MLLLALSYYLIVIITGFAGVCMMLGATRKTLIEVAGLSFCCGNGIVSLVLFLASLAGHVPSRGILCCLAAVSICVLIYLRIRGGLMAISWRRLKQKESMAWKILFALSILLIGIGILNVAARALTPGLADVDDFAIWMFKAKIVAHEPLRPVPAVLLDPALSFSHQDYPFSFPFLVAGMYAMVGGVVEQYGKSLNVLLFLSLVAISFSTLKRIVRPSVAAAITAVFVAMPVLGQQAGMAFAELPLLMFLLTTIGFLLSWTQTQDRPDLIAFGVFASFVAFTKNEGLALLPIYFFLIALFCATIRRKTCLIDMLIALAVVILATIPWLLYRTHLPRTHEDYGTKLTHWSVIKENLPRLKITVPHFFEQMIEFQNAGLFWMLLGVSALVGWRSFYRKPVLVLWGLLLAHLSLYVATFMVTPWRLSELMPMIGPKLLMQTSPTAALLIALHLSSLQTGEISDARLSAKLPT